MDVLNDFGKRIRYARKKSGFSQEKLAKSLGITTSGVGNYETGKSKPSIEILVKISELCQVSVDWLTKGKNESEFQLETVSSKPQDNGTFGDDIEKQMMRNIIDELRKDKEYLQLLLKNVTSGKVEVIDVQAGKFKQVSDSVTQQHKVAA